MTIIDIEPFETREQYLEFLKKNPGKIIFKFGAEWCAPCKRIEPLVKQWFNKMPEDVYCATIDVDDNFDVAAFLKTKKIVVGYPTILCYNKGNETFVPDAVVSGANEKEIETFFKAFL